MFTGLVQNLGKVTKSEKTPGGMMLAIIPREKFQDLKIGESIAINGCCLTLVKTDQDTLFFDVSAESLRVTQLKNIALNDVVNLERALLPTDRIGGHFVLGHVDCVGSVQELLEQGGYWQVSVVYPRQFQTLLISKGSICVDGISLTINALDDEKNGFSLTIIPETWNRTTCQFWQKNQEINLEFDILGKYALRTPNPSLE